MKPSRLIRRSVLVLMAAGVALATQPVFAQGKITRLVVGFPPGGPIDFVARILSEQLSKELGHQVIVENKPGANAGIAAEFVIRSAPDGYTLFMTSTGAVAISPALYEKLPYDPVRDLAPVTLVVNTAEVLVASASNPSNTAQEFIATAGQRKDGATLASSGIGSVPHLAMELLADQTKANLRHVPYKGVAPAITDVIAGHVDALFIDVPVALAHIKSGKLKALGIAAPKRHPMLPDTKTLQEMGISGVDSDNWYAIFAPKATPPADIERAGQAVRRALETESVKSKLLASGVEPAPTSPAGLAALLKADSEKWARIIRAKAIKGE
jgi:tripartite-type tricarboxylate transporter receptor subunit TctC